MADIFVAERGDGGLRIAVVCPGLTQHKREQGKSCPAWRSGNLHLNRLDLRSATSGPHSKLTQAIVGAAIHTVCSSGAGVKRTEMVHNP